MELPRVAEQKSEAVMALCIEGNDIPGIAEYKPRLLGRCQGSATAERGARSAVLTPAGPRLLSGYPGMSSTSPRSFFGTLFGALLQ